MATVSFSRQPRRKDKNSHLIVQKNAQDLADNLGTDPWYPPFVPRRDDPEGALVVQLNLIDLAKYFGLSSPFNFSYHPRREDPFVSLVVQKNLEQLAKAI